MARPRKVKTNTNNTNNINQNQPEDQLTKHYFAVSEIYAESMNYKPVTRPFTKDKIETALRNPLKSYQTLQAMSNYLYATSSAYQNIIDYMSNIMAFDYILSPKEFTDNKTTMMNRLILAAKKAKQSQVKTVFPKMLERTLIQGETYWYTLTDSDNTIYVEIPARFCEVCEIDSNNLFRYNIKLNLLNENIVKSLPEEIKLAFNNFQNKNDNSKKSKNNKSDLKYKVSENGFAILAHGMLDVNDYPYFANMFPDLLQLEEDKEYLNSDIKDSSVKMVHNKIQTDENGLPLMPEPIIRQYHTMDKNHVPKNVSVSTTPFEKSAISFDNSSNTQINLVEQSKKNVQDDSGISSLVFNNEKASSNALKDAIRADRNRIIPFLKFFNAILSYQLKSFKFNAVFLETDRFTKSDSHEDIRTDLQNGGNRMLFIATSELEIYDFFQIAKLEKIIDIDDYLPIMIPGSQQSGIETEKKNGRPEGEKGNISDAGETSKEYR